MLYDFSFTIPANTAKESPLELDCKLTFGIVHHIWITFPPGCAGLAHLVVREGLHQIWPTNPDGSFNFDSYTMSFDEHYELFEPPFWLTLVGWNEDDSYQHTLEVCFAILPEEVLLPEKGLMATLKKAIKRLGL